MHDCNEKFLCSCMHSRIENGRRKNMHIGKIFSVSEGEYTIHATKRITANTGMYLWFLYQEEAFQKVVISTTQNILEGDSFYNFNCFTPCMIAVTHSKPQTKYFISRSAVEIDLRVKAVYPEINVIC